MNSQSLPLFNQFEVLPYVADNAEFLTSNDLENFQRLQNESVLFWYS